MNLLLAVILTAVVLYQGVEKAAYEDQPVVVGVVTRGIGGGEGRHPARRPDRVGRRATASTTGISSSSRSAPRPKREVDDRLLRDGLEETRKVTPARWRARAASRSATSACCRTSIRTAAVIVQGEPAERAGLKAGDVIAGRRRQADHLLTISCSEAIAKHPEQPIARVDSARRPTQTISVTPAQARRRTASSASASVDDTISAQAAASARRSR